MHDIIYLLYLEFLAMQHLCLQFIKRPVSAIRWYDYTTSGPEKTLQFNILFWGDIKKRKCVV